MTHHDLMLLVDYNYWARDRMLDAVRILDAERYTRDLGNSFPSVHDTLVHLYSAEWVWLSRWQGESPTTPIPSSRYPDLESLLTDWRPLEARLRQHVHDLDDERIAHAIDYRLMNGQPGRTPFWQMLQHLVNHGTYHRGQVTTMLRQLGAAPPKALDLIYYYRERAA
jgi:uncharacterized damage-inducible protein DinB